MAWSAAVRVRNISRFATAGCWYRRASAARGGVHAPADGVGGGRKALRRELVDWDWGSVATAHDARRVQRGRSGRWLTRRSPQLLATRTKAQVMAQAVVAQAAARAGDCTSANCSTARISLARGYVERARKPHVGPFARFARSPLQLADGSTEVRQRPRSGMDRREPSAEQATSASAASRPQSAGSVLGGRGARRYAHARGLRRHGDSRRIAQPARHAARRAAVHRRDARILNARPVFTAHTPTS